MEVNKIIEYNVMNVPWPLPDSSVDCIVTSPPYWGLRDYNMPDQLGLESTPEEYVFNLLLVFSECHRVLKDCGTLWLNLGDSYNGYPGNIKRGGKLSGRNQHARQFKPQSYGLSDKSLKPKDLVGIPWLTAFALRSAGWFLRQDIIWNKPNPMPESVVDRCTKSHEYIFLFAKSGKDCIWKACDTNEWSTTPNLRERLPDPTNPNKTVPRWRGYDYYFDQDSIRVPLKDASIARLAQDLENQRGSERVPGKNNGNMKAAAKNLHRGVSPNSMKAARFGGKKYGDSDLPIHRTKSGKEWKPTMAGGGGINSCGRSGYFDAQGNLLVRATANRKSVWTVSTKPFNEAHFATFPEELITPCIMAGCPQGGIVLDPFIGAGTTGLVALSHGRNFFGFELNPKYITIAEKRLRKHLGMFYR